MIFTNRVLYLFGMSMYIRVTQVDECLLCTTKSNWTKVTALLCMSHNSLWNADAIYEMFTTDVGVAVMCASYAMDTTVISYIALTLRAMHLSLTSIRSLSFKKRLIQNVFSKPSNKHTVPLSKKARNLPLPQLYQHRICFVVDSLAGVDSILDRWPQEVVHTGLLPSNSSLPFFYR